MTAGYSGVYCVCVETGYLDVPSLSNRKKGGPHGSQVPQASSEVIRMAPLPPTMMGNAPSGPGPTPPGGTGPATVPSPMAGSGAQGANAVRMALTALQQALPHLPMGSDLHTAVLKSVTELSKHVGEQAGAADPSAVVQQLAQLAAKARTQSVPPALAGAPPGAPPPAMGAPPPGAQAA